MYLDERAKQSSGSWLTSLYKLLSSFLDFRALIMQFYNGSIYPVYLLYFQFVFVCIILEHSYRQSK